MTGKTMIITAIAAGVIVAGVVAAFAMSSDSSVPATTTTKPAGTQSVEQITTLLMSPSVAGAPALGSGNATVTIVEFGDYQCTWCMRFHEGTKDQLMTSFVDTGKIRFLFKDYPINDLSDRASSLAAEGSYCAADQGKYWEYHNEVYSIVAYLYNNKIEGENSGYMTKDFIKQSAESVGVSDMKAFSDCLDSGKYAKVVRDNYNLARSIGLDATPSFIVLTEGETPKLLRGAHPYSTFEKVINEAYTS
jgi:protein-disulfide isomerase